MKAVIVTPGEKNSVRLSDIPKPECGPDEVLIKTIRVGVDGTDREINAALYGMAPSGQDFLVLGHEAIGKIVEIGSEAWSEAGSEVGSEVGSEAGSEAWSEAGSEVGSEAGKSFKESGSNSLFKIGDIVVPIVRRPDSCNFCQNEQSDMCITGNYTERGIKGAHGYMSEYFSEKPQFLVKVPEEIEEIGVLLEPMSVVEKGIRHCYKIQERMLWQPKTAVVFGLGPIGILAALILSLKNLEVYIYSREDRTNPKVKMVERAGIKYIKADIDILDLPSKLGNIDIIIEATGNSVVSMNAMSVIGTNGILCLTGVTGGHKPYTLCADCLNLSLVLGNKTIFGTVNANIVDFREGVKHLLEISRKYPGIFKIFIKDQFPLEKYKDAIENFRGNKAIIKFE